jgi:hypothetical protein
MLPPYSSGRQRYERITKYQVSWQQYQPSKLNEYLSRFLLKWHGKMSGHQVEDGEDSLETYRTAAAIMDKKRHMADNM